MLEMKSKRISILNKHMYLLIIAMMAITIVLSFYYLIYFGRQNEALKCLEISISIIGMVFAMILFAGCSFKSSENSKLERIFTYISGLLFLEILLSGISNLLNGNVNLSVLLFIIQSIAYIVSSIVHLLFWSYLSVSFEKNKMNTVITRIIHTLMILYFSLIITNPFTRILFYVDGAGNFVFSGELIDLISFSSLYVLYLIYIIPQRCSIKKKIVVSSFSFFPIFYLIISAIWVKLNIEITNDSVGYIFMLVALYVAFFGDYKGIQEELLNKKAELAKQEQLQSEMRTSLMLSQIKPHFLYNSITAIRNLCKKDSIEAYESLGLFADYLRTNMDALENGRMIPFEKELEHVKTYLMLEQMRFTDDLKVEYDIEYTDFSLPALTVQPIVENAVKHGATMNENGGKVLISCRKTTDGAVITISDNGPGFDINSIYKDENNHFGIKNVSACLEAKGCGEILIDSVLNKGTTVTILIKE